jgi:adenylate kinase
MGDRNEEIQYLKSLVSQLNDKISALEAKPKPPKSPARQLRTILLGPPGAGASPPQRVIQATGQQ